ncbi:cytochrome P450 6B6-like isoform X1 [Choristoneura fumiferana]|uniref:cytochrome P450 6B6-like isoform X1 n=1 Tax=Choristoneura fumiferana TaxID=7141 RepID=UPI003D15C4D8
MIVIAILGSILGALYLYFTRTFKYWEKKGVKHDTPLPLFGNWAPVLLAKKSEVDFINDLYWKYPDERAVGYYRSSRPDLLVRDPNIVKRILTTDFQYFYARGIVEMSNDPENIEMIRKHLVIVEGDIWRLLRQSSTPAFTSGKLKAMFPLIVERAERLRERTRAISAGARHVDARDLMARYTMDFIAACGLGIDGEVLKDEHSAFLKIAKEINKVDVKLIIIEMLKTFFPYTFRHVKIREKVEKMFCDLVGNILKQRDYKPSSRNDFIDVMLEVKNKGKIECDSMEKMKSDGTPEKVSIEIDDNLIAAQAFVFFTAGYETSSSSTSYTLHEIAYNPEKQEKIHNEIDRVLAKHDNKLSYDAIKEMQYLEWAFKEGLRLLPPIGVLFRTCRQKYTFEELGLTVDANTRVMVSPHSLHRDPKYWDHPEEFRPERFSPEFDEPKHKFAYLPFGYGPRACIGERMGLMQSLAGLAAILSQFSVSPAPTSVRRPLLDPKSNLVQNIKGGLPLIFTPRT